MQGQNIDLSFLASIAYEPFFWLSNVTSYFTISDQIQREEHWRATPSEPLLQRRIIKTEFSIS